MKSPQSTKRIELVSDGKAVAFNPALLTRVQAAIYCACSVGLLDKLRAADAKRRLRGEPISGPAWERPIFGIRYKPASLDALSLAKTRSRQLNPRKYPIGGADHGRNRRTPPTIMWRVPRT